MMSLPLQDSRNRIIMLFGVLNIALFVILRMVFYVLSSGQMGNAILHVPGIFVTGLIYDVVFSFYFAIFFAILLLVVPNKIYASPAYRCLTCGSGKKKCAEGQTYNRLSDSCHGTARLFVSNEVLVFEGYINNTGYAGYPD